MESGVRTHPRQDRSRDKRDRILAAAGSLLERMPYEQLSTKEIAAEADVSVGSLYRFFVDKQAIVDALAQRWLDRIVDVLDGALAGPPVDVATVVGRVVDSYASFWRGDHEFSSPGLRQIWFGSVKVRFAPGANAENDRQLVDRLYAVFTDGLGDEGGLGHEGGERLRQRLAYAVAVGDEMIIRTFREDPGGDPAQLAELKIMLTRYLS
jgi:AcrR family transcriptional regulator